jgi:very-short-patch-repair endonuclease
LLDVMRDAPLPVAVCLIDAVCRTDLALFDELTIIATASPGHRGMASAGRALRLSCPLAESLLETLLRLLIILAGLPAPDVQVTVRLGQMTYRADLGYRDKRLLLEADGRNFHSKWADVAADMTRQNALVAAGWRVLRFTWKQVIFQPHLVVRAIRAALAE